MDSKINIPEELFDDEIVCFLADRYHTTSTDIVRTYLMQDGITESFYDDVTVSFRLESNEMEMMRGLTQTLKTTEL